MWELRQRAEEPGFQAELRFEAAPAGSEEYSLGNYTSCCLEIFSVKECLFAFLDVLLPPRPPNPVVAAPGILYCSGERGMQLAL